MTSQYQYQLDNEYRNRRMAQAENDRLAQEAQPAKQQSNPFGAVLNTVQRMVNSRPQAASSAQMPDTLTVPAVS